MYVSTIKIMYIAFLKLLLFLGKFKLIHSKNTANNFVLNLTDILADGMYGMNLTKSPISFEKVTEKFYYFYYCFVILISIFE